MSHFSTLERTQMQWRELIASAGLRVVKVYMLDSGNSQGIVEAEI